MKKLCFIGFLLALPTTVVTFFWLTTIGWFDWVDGMRCAGAIIANMVAMLASVMVALFMDDGDISAWTDSWKDHRAPSIDDLKAREILKKYNV